MVWVQLNKSVRDATNGGTFARLVAIVELPFPPQSGTRISDLGNVDYLYFSPGWDGMIAELKVDERDFVDRDDFLSQIRDILGATIWNLHVRPQYDGKGIPDGELEGYWRKGPGPQ